MSASPDRKYDTIVIGSGFGGALTAHALVRAGERVLLVERGGWVERGERSWDPVAGFFQLTEGFTTETAYRVEHAGRRSEEGICACVGGASVFYGGASFRFRREDFAGAPEIVGDTGARWPVSYQEMEPYYTMAERLLGVAGEAGADPTEPPRGAPYPQPPAPLSWTSERIAAAARRLGLHPFRIPMALNHAPDQGAVCVSCVTCDAYACRIGAKNDLATRVLGPLHRSGALELASDTVVTRLVEAGGRVDAVEAVERHTGRRVRFRGARVVLAAGALASPHLLLASGLERLNPGGAVVGRYLMRHCNAFVYGVFPRPMNPGRKHHKQVAIHDYYFGDPEGDAPTGKLGNLQQIMAPQIGGVLRVPARLGRGARRGLRPVAWALGHLTQVMTGLQVIAEDQPRRENRVELDTRSADRFGLPRARVVHDYSERDLRARSALIRRAQAILKEAGAAFTFPYLVTTFSHAVGTVRMGEDPRTSALDEHCRFRGVDNLYVVDGSFMPTSAGVNPSLTIAANALRVGDWLAKGEP